MLSKVALWLAFCAIAFSGKHQNPLVFEKNGGPGNSEKPQDPSPVRALVTLCLSSRRRAATFLFILLSDVARGVTLRCCGSECSPILYSMHKSVSFSNAENDIAMCASTG